MAHACFAGVLGYALGRAKFAGWSGPRRAVHLGGGLILAAVLNGLFHILEQRVTSAGLSSRRLLRHVDHDAPAPGRLAAREERMSEPKQGFFWEHDLLVPLAALVVLAIGWSTYGARNVSSKTAFDRQGLTFAYPSGWFPEGSDEDKLPVDLVFESTERRVFVHTKIGEKPELGGAEVALEISRARKYTFYKRLASTTKNLHGREWTRTEFAYAFQPTPDDLPEVQRAVEYSAVNGDKVYAVSVHGPEGKVAELESSILSTVSLK
jgi:hypothetical protein